MVKRVFFILLTSAAILCAQPYAYMATTGSTVSVFAGAGLQETGAIGFPGPVQYFAMTPMGSTRSSPTHAAEIRTQPFGE